MKSLLLAKSNFRKNKGLSICISILLLIASMFICLSFLLVFDYNKNAYKQSKKLNTPDMFIYSSSDATLVTKEYIDSIIPSSVEEYLYQDTVCATIAIDYNNGEVSPYVIINKEASMKRNMPKLELIEEDETITSNYLYVPYHLHVGGGYKIGDTYTIKLEKTYTFTIKGYVNQIYGGSYQAGSYEFFVSDEMFDKIEAECPSQNGFSLYMNFKDDANQRLETNKIINKIFAETNVGSTSTSVDNSINNRTFIATIFFISFLLTAVIIILIVILMVYNNISNYVKENMRNLGALKAMGYTTKDLKGSIYLQFIIICLIGLVFGILAGHLFLPTISGLLIRQSGIPYCTKFNMLSTIITVIIIPTFVLLMVALSSRKLKKIEPIVALRDGVETHNFKKNMIPLDKTKLGLNMSLSLKNTFKNIKQNVISFITVLVLSFLMVIAIVMFQNFSLKPKLGMLTFEMNDGIVLVEKSKTNEVWEYLNEHADNNKYLTQWELQDMDYSPLFTYIVDDFSKMNNVDVCYKGRFPKMDNEVVIAGKYASSVGLKIGDEITLQSGDRSFTYLITGFTQTCNNGGQECAMTKEGGEHLLDLSNMDSTFWFDKDGDASQVLKDVKEEFGDSIISTMDINETIKAQIGVFVSVANIMVTIISIITAAIIILVLYILMKNIIRDRRYEYGILKAVGYRSKDLIIQNVLSFMPTLFLGTVIGTVISYFIATPYIGLMMRSFGIMKCTMVVPIPLLILSVVFMMVISVIAGILMSLKIRKIEPYKLLIGE